MCVCVCWEYRKCERSAVKEDQVGLGADDDAANALVLGEHGAWDTCDSRQRLVEREALVRRQA